MEHIELAKLAVKAKELSVPTYSNFHVGAALLTEEGKTYIAGNIETASYSLTICAERNAIFQAITAGERKFNSIAIASDTPGFCPPCGACRQVILDLCGDVDVIMINHKEEILVKKATELLPLAFTDKDLV